ncbi:CcdB family protein [Glaciimonas sp. GG7]
MARFDIYSNRGKSKKTTPYLIDVQSNVISGLATRTVIPLRALTEFAGVRLPDDLCPMISVLGDDYFLDTPQLAAIPLSALTDKVGSAEEYRLHILAALDRAFGAY